MTDAAFLPFLEQTMAYFDRPHEGPATAPVAALAAWKRRDIETAPWRVTLDTNEVDELNRALAAWRRANRPLAAMTKADFPLPRLAPKIAGWRAEVANGRGFQVISGLPVKDSTADDAAIFFWGLGLHLGRPGAQNRKGDLLGHVRDTGADRQDRYVRQYLTTQNIPFHCDAADMVGLLCLQKAKSGGLSRIASSVSVFNEVLARRPDLAPRLFETFMLDTRDEAQANGMKVLPVPICRFAGGALRTFWHSEYFRTAQRHQGVRLTDADNALFDLYDQISGSSEFHLDMDLQPGDIQLLSNHTIIHARTDYEDHPKTEKKRHLLRLWITL